MLKLDRVSKYYSSDGIVSTGFSKVSLELERGEFVAITGESGSGKSTLLNVISGLDSFEEGEMYIDGQATSGYTTEEMEEYRKKYVVNIFQSFNLVNSYTVYQNVELVLLMNGLKKSDIKDKAVKLIERVGLSEYMNTKASKLSGGQKQRVAIARALAKESPIIVADEPTGNLDTQSAADIVELLYEVSKERLVIVVTHNYEQVEPYVTRKITMSDGRIVEDKVLKEKEDAGEQDKPEKAGKLKTGSMFRLGMRNTFNIPAKFVLLFVVFVFLCGGSIALYASVQNLGSESENGWNQYFSDTSKERLIITREDRSEIKDKDYEKIEKLSNIDKIIKNDLSIDASYALSSDEYYISLAIRNIDDRNRKLIKGRMPEKDSEAILLFPKDSYVEWEIDNIYKKSPEIYEDSTGNLVKKDGFKVVGYGYLTQDEADKLYQNGYKEAYMCLEEKAMDELRFSSIQRYCSQEIEYADTIQKSSAESGMYTLMTSDKVPEGKVYIPEEISMLSEKNAVGQKVKITNSSLYFKDKYEFEVGAVYTEQNMNYYLERKDFSEVSGSIFMNPKDFREMFDKENFQSTVMVKDKNQVDVTAAEIEKLGFKVFKAHDGLVSYSEGMDALMKVLRIALMLGGLTVLFFVSYFIIKLVLRSRNIYYSTIRMLGATKENCRGLLKVDLFTVFNISFAACLAVVILIREKIIEVSDYVVQMFTYLNIPDFIILYVLLCATSILLAGRYSRQLFKNSAMNVYKEEV